MTSRSRRVRAPGLQVDGSIHPPRQAGTVGRTSGNHRCEVRERRRTEHDHADVAKLGSHREERAWQHDGGVMSYGPDFRLLHRASAAYVDRILKGAKPGDLPVHAPDEIDLTINLKAANALAITIPRAVLLQAREVIR